ncbi:MAG TPA: hypothetical protein VJA27_04035 [Patescibacteria group bacterium]|nr:hypothetical protein [Patescibacteria group bacterium]
MYLCIDNSSDEQIVVRYKILDRWEERIVRSGSRQRVLSAIEELLGGMQKQLGDVQAILVVVGKGRFTATRVATTVANTLAMALQIPVEAVLDSTNETLEKALVTIPPVGRHVSAEYSGEAHIGGKNNTSS